MAHKGTDYVYVEASWQFNQKAMMKTNAASAGQDRCIEFWYHMFGAE